MKAKFIGDPSEAKPDIPDSVEVFGLTFEKGKATEIPAKLAAKFAANSHFETDGAAPKVKADAEPIVRPFVVPEDPTIPS